LRLQSSSAGDLEALTDDLGEGKVQYAFIRFKVSEGYKFVYIAWCGEGVSGMPRGNFANHATDFENFLTQNKLGFHVRINARSENDLKEEDIVKKINAAKGANFVKAGTKKEGTGPDLKQVSQGFWNKQTQIDQQHNAAMSAQEKAKVAKLEQSKEEEANRLKQRADAELARRDAAREAEHNAHVQSEASRAKAFDAHRNKELQRVNKDLDQMRAHAPRAEIGTASDARADAPAHNRFKAPEPAPSQRQDEKWAPPSRGGGAPPGRGAFAGGGAPAAGGPPPAAPKPKPAPVPVAAPEPAADEGWGAGGDDAAGGYSAGGDAGGYGGGDDAAGGYGGGDDAAGGYSAGGDAGGGYSAGGDAGGAGGDEWGADAGAGGGDADPGYGGYSAGGGDAGGGGGDAGGGQYIGTCTALYDFPGENEGDLPFQEGDTINIIDNSDAEGWWHGELRGATGYFPRNFVN
jgi:hypothetical protein